MLYKDNVVLVTGGSKGIGRAISLAFAKEGATVIINYQKDCEAAKEVEKRIKDSNGKAIIYQASVVNYNDIKRMVQDIREKFGRLDILVNNAGITKDNFLALMSEKAWDDVINTNLKGVFNCSKVAANIMINQKRGCIINISSVGAFFGQPGQTNYAASKGGIISFTKALARELSSFNIRVNAIAPGFIETDMTIKVSQKISDNIKNHIALKRFGTPQDVANAVLFLASSQASYITGAVLVVDGGLTT